MKLLKKSLLSSNNTLIVHKARYSKDTRRFLQSVQRTARKFTLWEDGDCFVVGVSGGPDSVCLLDVLMKLASKHRFTLHIAHVNYHLRGQASDADEIFVRSLATHYHLPFTVLSVKKTLHATSEAKMRDIRYAFFEKVRKKIGAQSIVVGHHLDDQAETLLLRLMRGSGLSGLAGMRPKNERLIRPLIEISRKDILTYIKTVGITFHTDESNTDQRYMRNRIRHTLLPFLETEFQPQIRKILAETALLLGVDSTLFEQYSHPLPITYNAHLNEWTFSRHTLLALPDPLITHELRRLLRPFLSQKNPTKHLLAEIIQLLKSEKNKAQTLTFQGLKVIRKGDIVRLFRH